MAKCTQAEIEVENITNDWRRATPKDKETKWKRRKSSRELEVRNSFRVDRTV